MSLKITFNNPSFEKGTEFEVAGIGLVENGTTRELADEEETAFVAYYGEAVKDRLKGDESFTVEGTATVTAKDMPIILGVDVSDTPPLDPTAMNMGEDGKKFADHNLLGISTPPETSDEGHAPAEALVVDNPTPVVDGKEVS